MILPQVIKTMRMLFTARIPRNISWFVLVHLDAESMIHSIIMIMRIKHSFIISMILFTFSKGC